MNDVRYLVLQAALCAAFFGWILHWSAYVHALPLAELPAQCAGCRAPASAQSFGISHRIVTYNEFPAPRPGDAKFFAVYAVQILLGAAAVASMFPAVRARLTTP